METLRIDLGGDIEAVTEQDPTGCWTCFVYVGGEPSDDPMPEAAAFKLFPDLPQESYIQP